MQLVGLWIFTVLVAVAVAFFFSASSRKRSDEVPRDNSLLQDSPQEESSVIEENRELLHSDMIVSLPARPTWEYQVFLSFRGKDTRLKFTDHLYHALCRAGISTFKDDEELRTGDVIRPSILSAIEGSRISIIVFSKEYASSTWCLDELVKILECKKERNQIILPIFYEVEPSDIRHQTGSVGKDMAMHEKRYKNSTQKVEKWRSALREVSDMSGESYQNDMPEFKFVDKIIKKVSIIVDQCLLHLPEQAVRLESQRGKVVSLLNIRSNDQDISMVGIYGVGGIGKTTIAKDVYNSIATQFESQCFCADVRENTARQGLLHIQQTILTDMLKRNDISFSSIDKGIQVVKERLRNKRVLLVLDDVDDLEQLQKLAGGCDWFGPGSRVIITSRDKHLLSRHGIEKIYEVKELDKVEALQLLCWNAFKSDHPKSGFEDVSSRVLSYAGGIPLALEIIGSHLFGKDVKEWESAMNAYERSMDNKIFTILKISYESLEYTKKEIFLNIACIFRGWRFEELEKILDACGLSAKSGLRILEERCLVKRQGIKVWMHDLTQSMGREIVRRESERDPGKMSKIWSREDALQVLTNNTGTSKVFGLKLVFPQKKEVQWSGEAFKKMKNLRILIIRNAVFSKAPKELPASLKVLEWEHYPSSCLPPDFVGEHVMWLRLTNTPLIAQLFEPFKKFPNITILRIGYCKGLEKVSGLSAVPHLTQLVIHDCQNLVEIHNSIGSLDKLIEIVVASCLRLEKISGWNQSKSLKCLSILNCPKLRIIPFGALQKTLTLLLLHDNVINFQSDLGSALIQELMDRHCSHVYFLSCISEVLLPRCFRYQSSKNLISFWIQQTIPDVHLCFALNDLRSDVAQGVILYFRIGPLLRQRKLDYRIQAWATTTIYWLPCLISEKRDPEIQELLRSQSWVRVDICMFIIIPTDCSQLAVNNVSGCGVYESPTGVANFSFQDPYSDCQSVKDNRRFTGSSAENERVHHTKVALYNAMWNPFLRTSSTASLVKDQAWEAISTDISGFIIRTRRGTT